MAEVKHGDASNEQIVVTADKTQAYGLKGNDTLISDSKQDLLLIGGSGNDSLVMMGGNGTLSGGKGSDTFELTYSADKPLSAVIEDYEAGDKIVINHVGDTAPQLTSSSLNNGDVVWKDSEGYFNLTLKSVRENDYFDGDAHDEAWEVFRLTNSIRGASGLPLLTLSDGLTEAAQIRTGEITEKGKQGLLTDHTRLDNKTSWSTVFDEVGKQYTNAQENLDGGASTPELVIADWMNSSLGHRENILKENSTKLGVGYNYEDSDPSNLRYYWVQEFAESLSSPAPKTVSTSDLSKADIQTNAVSKAVELVDNAYNNANYGATIDAQGGNDKITNTGAIVSISGGAGKDTITNSGSNVTICAGAGNDIISLTSGAKENLIQYTKGDGSDTIKGFRADDTLSISGSEYKLSVVNNDIVLTVDKNSIKLVGAMGLSAVNINSTQHKIITGNEEGSTIKNLDANAIIRTLINNVIVVNGESKSSIASDVTISGGEFRDSIQNYGTGVSISGGDGNDNIENRGSNVTIIGGEDNDSILNYAATVTIHGGEGDDSIYIKEGSTNVSIDGGLDDDLISLASTSKDNLIQYMPGEGDDKIYGFNATSTLRIGDGTASYFKEIVGNDVVISVSDGKITLVGAATLNTLNIDGTAETDSDVIDKLITLSADNDSYVNSVNGATIQGLGGNDSIHNNARKVFIDGGDDSDSISNNGEGVSIDGGDDSDYISNDSERVSINGGEGNDSISNNGVRVSIDGGDGSDSISNNGNGAFIDGGADNDSISNNGAKVSIDGDAGDDFIYSNGSNVTIVGGIGYDQISLTSGAKKNLIRYTDGDGNDLIEGFDKDDTLIITENITGNVSSLANDSDVIITVGDGKITLTGATSLLESLNVFVDWNDPIIPADKRVTFSETNDRYDNTVEGVTIQALGGNDSILNGHLIYNNGDDTVKILGEEEIQKSGTSNVLRVGYANVSIDGGTGNDTIRNYGDNVTVNAGGGNDSIKNYGHSVRIDLGAGADSINNTRGQYTTIYGGAGDDRIYNYSDYVTIDGGADNDSINTWFGNVSIAGGDGNDTLRSNRYANVTLNGGKGNDQIRLGNDSKNNLIEYTEGDGDDTIWGFQKTDTLKIGNGTTDTYSTTVQGDDVIVKVGTGSIRLVGLREKPKNIVLGESGSEGGIAGKEGNGNDGSGGGSSGGNGGNGSGGNGSGGNGSGGNGSGGSGSGGSGSGGSGSGGNSPSNDNPNNTNTNNQSNTGDNISNDGNISTGNISSGGNVSGNISGVNTKGNINTSGNIKTGGSINTNENRAGYSGGNNASATTFSSPFDALRTTPPTANQHVYAGGNQVINNYQAGEKIIFGATYTGAMFDDAGNFLVGSSTGALAVTNATDKVIDLIDYAGNAFLKAYAASTAGIIDGRGIAGFEVIKGSTGADVIFAGDNGIQLWGGVDVASDTLVGGAGTDIFIGGKTQGGDVFLNASSTDIVHLNDATLSDIIGTAEANGVIAVAFNTGNVIAVQSSEPLSAAFLLADGSAYRYNHVAKTWQPT